MKRNTKKETHQSPLTPRESEKIHPNRARGTGNSTRAQRRFDDETTGDQTQLRPTRIHTRQRKQSPAAEDKEEEAMAPPPPPPPPPAASARRPLIAGRGGASRAALGLGIRGRARGWVLDLGGAARRREARGTGKAASDLTSVHAFAAAYFLDLFTV